MVEQATDDRPRDRFPSLGEKSDIIMSPRTLPRYGDYRVAAKVSDRAPGTRVVRANDPGEFFSRVHGVSSFIKADARLRADERAGGEPTEEDVRRE